MTTPSSNEAKIFTLNRVGGILLLIALTTFIAESPIKFALAKLHSSQAIYFRDAFAASITILTMVSWSIGRSYSPTVIVLPILVLHMLYGMLILGSIIQPIISLKIFSYFLLGTAAYTSFKQNIQVIQKWMIAMFSITILGIFLSAFIDMPWKGEVFDSAAGSVELSREWTTGGITRISGFARASYDASTYVTILGAAIALIPSIGSAFRLAIIFATGSAIWMTTSKGSMLALLLIIPFIYKNHQNTSNRAPRWIYFSPAFLLAIPATLYIFEFRTKVGGDLWFLLSSFAERINWMWPRAFDLMQTPWNVFLGRGLGGIGFAQRFGEGTNYNSADNTMVYLFVTFGLLSLVYVYKIIHKLAQKSDNIPTYIWNCFMCWIIYWTAYGFTTNIIENAPFSFCLGLMAGAALTPIDKNGAAKNA